ncbi:MAG TPA: NADPH-dependent F420 reductase [Burkholderiales bacterium]|nr:NADPH-dependent F420 reductase [Burkholderiales bacterium]
MNHKRRAILAAAGAMLLAGTNPASAQNRMKIGVIGSGRVGGTIGELWVKAGHEVMFSARAIEEVTALLAKLNLGPLAHAGTPKEAAAFGEAVLISVPYAALPQIGRDNAAELKGKVVLDTSNPIENRDGTMAVEMRNKGTGVASAELLPGVRLVRAFNCVGWNSMRTEAHRAGEKLAIPLAADDQGALKVAIGLVQDAGFEPVVVGGLARAKEFDVGTPVFGKALTATELRKILGLS